MCIIVCGYIYELVCVCACVCMFVCVHVSERVHACACVRVSMW